MVARVFSLADRRERESVLADWTRDELAELYRIEHVLIQSGLTLEVDRGLSDEGDPWFAFSRPDGEVLVHLTRYDGLYRLHSPALPTALIGRTFVELTKAFARQASQQITVQRTNGTRLFIHPAAMLAVVVGTIFAASNELAVFPQTDEAGKKHVDGSYASTAHYLKTLLQTTFQSYIENFYSWLRDGSAFQQPAYIAMISTIAAFLVGSDTATSVDHARDYLAAGADVNGPGTHDGHSAPVVAESTDLDHHVDAKTPLNAPLAPDASSHQNQTTATMPHVAAAEANNPAIPDTIVAPQTDSTFANKVNDVAKLSLTPTNTNTDSEQGVIGQQNSIVVVNNTAHTDLSSGPSSSSTAATIQTAMADLLTALSSVTQSQANSTAAQNNATLSSDLSSLLSHATQLPLAQNSQFMTYVSEPTHTASAAVTVESFTATAATTLLNFLQQNPNAQAAFSNNNIVIYDSLNDQTAATIDVWKFADGSTISIVGHADHGLVA